MRLLAERPCPEGAQCPYGMEALCLPTASVQGVGTPCLFTKVPTNDYRLGLKHTPRTATATP